MLFVGNSRLNNFTGNTRGKYKNKRTTHGMMLTTSFFQKEKRNNYMEILPFFFFFGADGEVLIILWHLFLWI